MNKNENLYLGPLVVFKKIKVVIILEVEWPPKEPKRDYPFHEQIFLLVVAGQFEVRPKAIDEILLGVGKRGVAGGMFHDLYKCCHKFDGLDIVELAYWIHKSLAVTTVKENVSSWY
jgi:hypothetical protein